MSFIESIKQRAKADRKTIILPETMDERTYRAADAILKEGIANLILIGNKDEVEKSAVSYGVSIEGAKVIDPANYEKFEDYVSLLYNTRKAKGMTEEAARDILSKDYLTFGVVMIKAQDADGMVAGACHSTADTLRPSLQILKTKPNVKLVSGFLIMDVPNCELGENGVFLFADCGLNQDPDAEQLAAIADSSAKSFEALVGAKARIAMISHSTMGSAKHALVDKVHEATRIAKEQYPDILVDGEMQVDAALIPSVGQKKAPGSEVAGKANVLIFPNLDCGNSAYKLVERLAKAGAYGPVLQGIAKPVNDLSRGCCWQDIVGVVAITAVQAQLD